ncbi:hypothetical protein LPJ61_005613, partial [Coemansia biformis]
GPARACGTATSRLRSTSSTLWTACARRTRPPSFFCAPSPRLPGSGRRSQRSPQSVPAHAQLTRRHNHLRRS